MDSSRGLAEELTPLKPKSHAKKKKTCMVLGLKLRKPRFWGKTEFRKVGNLIKNSKLLNPRLKYHKRLRLSKLLRRWWSALLLGNLERLFMFLGLDVFGWLLPAQHRAFSCHLGYFDHSQVHNSAFLFDKGLRPQVLYSKVGGIVSGRLSKLIIMSFLFLPNRDFSPKYHLFDSILLSRIVSINTEQDLFIN